MIRPVTLADLDELLEIAAKAYPRHDTSWARGWAERAMADPNGHMTRSDHGFAVAVLYRLLQEPEIKRARLVYLAVHGANPMAMEGFRLLMGLWQWARANEAVFHFGSEAGDADLTPFAKRLGACQDTPSWHLGGSWASTC